MSLPTTGQHADGEPIDPVKQSGVVALGRDETGMLRVMMYNEGAGIAAKDIEGNLIDLTINITGNGTKDVYVVPDNKTIVLLDFEMIPDGSLGAAAAFVKNILEWDGNEVESVIVNILGAVGLLSTVKRLRGIVRGKTFAGDDVKKFTVVTTGFISDMKIRFRGYLIDTPA